MKTVWATDWQPDFIGTLVFILRGPDVLLIQKHTGHGAGLINGPAAADDFFGRVYFAGGYQQAMQAMAEGLVDAAGASQYADLLLTPEQQADVTWIAESDVIPSHVVIARDGLDAAIQTRFSNAMLKLNTQEHRNKLRYLYGPDGYVLADATAFDGVREMARRYGLLK